MRSAVAQPAVAASLVCGILDVTWNLVREPVNLADWRLVVLPLAVTALAAGICYATLYPLARAASRRIRADPTWLPTAMAAWLVLVVLAQPVLWGPESRSGFVAAATASFVLAPLLAALAWFGTTRLGRLFESAGLADRAAGLLLGLPLLLLTSLAFVLLWGPGASAGWRSGSLVAIYVLLSVSQIAWLWHRGSRHGRWLLAASAGAVCLAIAMALVPASGAWSRETGSGSGRIRQLFLVTIDTLRADELGFHGAPAGASEHLDALARDGVVFEQAIAPAPWTLPSMASVLTGLAPLLHQTGLGRSRLPDGVRTLAEHLQGSGYRTAAIGTNIHLRGSIGLSRGFDDYRLFPRLRIRSALGQRLLDRVAPALAPTHANTSDLTALAIRWLEEHADEDFFLWLHYFDPHLPYAPPAPHRPEAIPPGLGPSFDPGADVRSARLDPPAPEREWIRTLYRREITYVDDEIGRLVAQLKRLAIYEGALIVITSDHGEEFWEHAGFEHGHSLFNELLHVPLIVKPPAGLLPETAPRRVSTRVSTRSIAATILDLCGLPLPASDAVAPSLMPTWAGSIEPPEPAVFSTGVRYAGDGVAAYFGDLKYVLWLGDGTENLYDLARDPWERLDLAASRPDLVETGRALVEAHRQRQASHAAELRIEPDASEPHVDAQTLHELRALGYVE